MLLEDKVFSRLDELFFNAEETKREIAEYKSCRRADAFYSADPTGKEALEAVATVEHWRGIDQPELWLKAIENTWEKCKSKDNYIYKTMRMRYVLHKNWTQICFIQCISSNTYFRWRKEFLLFALVEATRLNIGVYKIIDQEQEDMEATNVHA